MATALVPRGPSKVAAKDKVTEKQLNYVRGKYQEKVKGLFRFYEIPGGCLSFCYKEFKGDQVEKYRMQDGMIYEIPLGVARHLNKNGWYPVHAYLMDSNGNKTQGVGSKVRRFGFQSLEFIDMEDITPVGVPESELSKKPAENSPVGALV